MLRCCCGGLARIWGSAGTPGRAAAANSSAVVGRHSASLAAEKRRRGPAESTWTAEDFPAMSAFAAADQGMVVSCVYYLAWVIKLSL